MNHIIFRQKKRGENRPALITQLKFFKFPCGKKPTPLLLFGGGLLLSDGFFDRLFRRSGFGGFFGHVQNLDTFFADGTQNFP